MNVRQCFIPRAGWVYIGSDYDTIELKALASVCLALVGHSEMAEALRRGEDLHVSFAANMLGISYAEALTRKNAGDNEIGEYRQLAKIANFGLSGGLGAATFVDYAAGMGVTISLEKSKWLKDAWFKRWPEMKAYFDLVAKMVEENGGTIVQLRSNRVRGGASFCAAANGFFQGLVSDGAKEALWKVAKECYVTKTSPLYGCRPVFFVHDEILIEAPFSVWGAERTARAAERLTAVMIEAMAERWIPDIPITSKPVITRRLYKGAEPVKVDGVLVPSKPVKVEENGKKFTRWVADL